MIRLKCNLENIFTRDHRTLPRHPRRLPELNRLCSNFGMRLACVLAVVLTCSVARADPEAAVPMLTAAAKDHHEKAMEFYKAEQYQAARVELQAGYELSKNPVFLWNLAKVAAKMGDRQAALDYVQRYRVTLDAPDPEVDALEKNLRGPGEPTQPPTTMQVQPVPSPPKVVARPDILKRSPAPWILLGVGAALLIADIGVAAAGYRLSKDNEGAMLTRAELDDLNARGGRLNAVGWSLFGIGLGSAAAGGIWLAVRR